ncbi:hypothetical protein [Larkinella soli]|nr:hypothetical protein [Larkinella soli]
MAVARWGVLIASEGSYTESMRYDKKLALPVKVVVLTSGRPRVSAII